jgi:hypothetical protein
MFGITNYFSSLTGVRLAREIENRRQDKRNGKNDRGQNYESVLYPPVQERAEK